MVKLLVSNRQGIIISQRDAPNDIVPKNVGADPNAWSALGKYTMHKPICTPGPRPKKVYATTIV